MNRSSFSQSADGQPNRSPFASLLGTATGPLMEINERCLAALTQMAVAPSSHTPELVVGLRIQFATLDGTGRRRAAALPFLLLNLSFHNLDRWRAITSGPGRRWQVASRTHFPAQLGLPLTRSSLTLIWTVARANPNAACILAGMTYPVATLFASLKLSDLDWIAEEQHAHLRPRWEDRPVIWRRLLRAAAAEDTEQLKAFQLHGIQLLAADFTRAPVRQST